MSEPLGTPTHITLHWTAGTHDMTFPEYHFCVKGSGQVVQTLSIHEKGAHCWGRNTGNIGISMCAMAPGHPVLPVQVEHTAKLVAELCQKYGLDPRAQITLPAMRIQGDRLVAQGYTLQAPVVTDHAWYAKKDGYFPERWDIDAHLAPIVNKAVWYLGRLLAGEAKPEFTTHLT